MDALVVLGAAPGADAVPGLDARAGRPTEDGSPVDPRIAVMAAEMWRHCKVLGAFGEGADGRDAAGASLPLHLKLPAYAGLVHERRQLGLADPAGRGEPAGGAGQRQHSDGHDVPLVGARARVSSSSSGQAVGERLRTGFAVGPTTVTAAPSRGPDLRRGSPGGANPPEEPVTRTGRKIGSED
ncbi:hypothetical protein GCM10009817_10300 [Terrabacter lapilli]|uniref:Uncharacterized protein n=1 Tax=Terrabacter lapilli TaxID=436231 RepID=A0ABN2RNJ3_9MICO